MANRDIAQQTLVEHETLKHITGSLRTILSWHAEQTGAARKLSSLRFVVQSFQRHLERLMALEEYDGYMSAVVQAKPRLSAEVQDLREEHGSFRTTLNRLVGRFEQLSPTEQSCFDAACEDLATLLQSVDAHSSREVHLLQDALLQDEGGEA